MIFKDEFLFLGQDDKQNLHFLCVFVLQRGPRGPVGPPGPAGVPGVDGIDVSQLFRCGLRLQIGLFLG